MIFLPGFLFYLFAFLADKFMNWPKMAIALQIAFHI